MLNRSEVSLTKWDKVITLKIDLRLLEISRLMSLKNSNPNYQPYQNLDSIMGRKQENKIFHKITLTGMKAEARVELFVLK